jgi:hypothetical protein
MVTNVSEEQAASIFGVPEDHNLYSHRRENLKFLFELRVILSLLNLKSCGTIMQRKH